MPTIMPNENTLPPAAAPHKPGKLLGIEAARGLAALLVALFHGAHVVMLSDPGRAMPFGGLFNFGHAGVPFFFVLSGFIIFFVHRADVGRPGRLGAFAWRRVTRIYPLFLAVMIPVTVKTVASGAFEWDKFIKSVLLLPQAELPMLIPAWTLVHEALFYLLFALAIWHARLSRVVLLAWLVLFAGARAFQIDFGTGFAGDLGRTLFSPYNLLFLGGIAVAWVVQRGPLPYARTIAAIATAGFLAVGMVENAQVFAELSEHSVALVLLYGATSMLIITGLAAAEREGSLRPGRAAGALGSLSYPLYLTHGMTISVAVGLAHKLHLAVPGWLLLVGAVALACVAAMLVHRWIEVPLARGLKCLHDGRRRPVAFPPVTRPEA